MPHYSPELVASVVHDYVHTDKPTRQIAADHHIDERDVTRIRHAEGVPTRRARVRALPPEMHEAHEITKRLKAAAHLGTAADAHAKNVAPSALNGPAPSIAPSLSGESEQDLRALVARLVRLVEQELAAEEATRTELGLLARTPTEAERCARIVASMTRSLRELVRLHAGLAPEQGRNNDHDIPADIDEFRRALARRIEACLESREADRGAERAAGTAMVDEAG